MLRHALGTFAFAAGMLAAQAPPAETPAAQPQAPGIYRVGIGSKVPLTLINSISTKHSVPGDRVYLETAFPILVNGRIVIPVGSYVSGAVTDIKKPGRVKGRGEIYIRFESLTLPNGVTRSFLARIGGLDGTASGQLSQGEGKVISDGNKAGDARTVGETTAVGASVGAIAGSAMSHGGMGLGIGSGAGAAAGLIAVLSTRGPDAVLAKGDTVEMVLDRDLTFTDEDLSFGNYQAPRMAPVQAPAAGGKGTSDPLPIRRIPK
jgi:type IV secretion system protein VirB10